MISPRPQMTPQAGTSEPLQAIPLDYDLYQLSTIDD